MARLGVVRQVPTVLFSCLAILLGMAGSASGAYVTLDAGNRVGVCGPNPNVYTYEFDPLALGSPRETTTGPYDFAPGRLPWTKFDPLGLWETGSYLGDVGQMWVGYGNAVKNTAVGLGTMVAHPVQTAKGVGQAVAHPVQTGKAIMADYAEKSQSLAGQGEILGDVLVGVATGGALKAANKVEDVASLANTARKAEKAAEGMGDSAKTTQKAAEAATDAAQMGEELAEQIGKNRVSVKTTGDRQLDIDLRGKSHFDKKTQTDVPTPHVKESKLVAGENGKINVDKKSQTTRPATKQDIRTARKVVEQRAKEAAEKADD